MDADDHVCLCFKVSLRKVVHYMERECPTVPSQLSGCLGAGTGCQWCVPALENLHRQWENGVTPDIPEPHAAYAEHRAAYRQARRDAAAAAAAVAAQQPGIDAPATPANPPPSNPAAPENGARG